jgi:hypothetical protein
LRKQKIAIQGSCISRDNFNSKFNPLYSTLFEVVSYQHQSSIISLMSKEVDCVEKIDNQTNDFQRWALVTDFNKNFIRTLKEKNPDYLLLDFFGDVYFGVLDIGQNHYISNARASLHKSTYYKELTEKKEISMSLNREKYLTLWKENVNKFFDLLSTEVPNCKVVVVNTKFTNEYFNNTTKQIEKVNETGKVHKIDVHLYTTYWNDFFEYVTNTFNVKTLDLTNKEYLADENHPWGISYVHYTKDFYNDFIMQFISIVVEDQQQEINKLKKETNLVQELKTKVNQLEEELIKERSKVKNYYEKESFKQFFARKIRKFVSSQ